MPPSVPLPGAPSVPPFRHDGYELTGNGRRLVCRYSLGDRSFTEEISFEPQPQPQAPAQAAAPDPEAADAVARIVYLLAGVSYYKTGAPGTVDLGPVATTADERRFLRRFYVEGLGEFAHRNGLDLSRLEIVGPDITRRRPVRWSPDGSRPLVPFGGGIDSIVTIESVRRSHPGASLFVVSGDGDRFEAIEQAARVAGLPVVRASRRIDPLVLRSAELGFLDGHVPVTGILSAIAVMAAVLGGHGAVVMSNERSASAATLVTGGRAVNHQWSKSLEFEAAFRELLAATSEPPVEYFSFLRARSELWVAQHFATLGRYHPAFRSCNRAFAIDPARRLDRWCGTCDKCCFVDLVLSPFLSPDQLATIFSGREPLADGGLADRFRALCGAGPLAKPFECVGDETECRTAAVLAAARPDRAAYPMLQALAAEARAAPDGGAGDPGSSGAARPFLDASGPDFVPSAYADRADGLSAAPAGAARTAT